MIIVYMINRENKKKGKKGEDKMMRVVWSLVQINSKS